MDRKHTPAEIETAVLTKSARRCILCFHLRGDLQEKHGQIAHLDQDPSNYAEDNLAFMCLDHHSLYDSKTSQHKNYTLAEVKAARARLYAAIEAGEHLSGAPRLPQGVFLDISAAVGDSKSWNRSQELLLNYAVERSESVVKISPEMGYSKLFNSGGPISPLDYITPSYCPFGWDFPQIDFKILNRGSEPLYLSEVILEIEESRINPAPLFAIKRDQQRRQAGELHLVNEGAIEIRAISIDFHLTPGTNASSFDPPFKHHLDLEVLEDRAVLDVTPAFREEGVEIDDLIRLLEGNWSGSGDTFVFVDSTGSEVRLSETEANDRFKKNLGRFQEEIGTLSGVISFGGDPEMGNLVEVRFSAEVSLSNLNRMGLTRPPSYTYDCVLDLERKAYTKRVQVSQTIQPGEADRFLVKVGAAQPSIHRFRALVRDVSGVEFASPAVELEIFVPRSRRKTLENKIQPLMDSSDSRE